MDAHVKECSVIESLDSHTDEMLRELIGRAKELLAARHAKRQAQALAQIRQLAADHGLDVKAKRRARKRGRPRKGDSLT